LIVKETIRAGLAAVYDARLVDELLDAHAEAKEKFYLGGLRLSEVEGGRFGEAAFRLLQQETTGTFDPLGAPLDTEKTIKTLAGLQKGSHPDSVRLHIPRALRVIYDIRNNRDAAHLADGIDPNLQDATLVVAIIDWVLAEFLRLHHSVSADEAQQIVEDLVTRQAPVIQDFDGFLKVLDPSLEARDRCLILLYQRGAKGAVYEELESWVHPKMRSNLRRTLSRLVNDKSFAHRDASGRYLITMTGQQWVESRKLVRSHRV
jgi:hypothetical protein